MIVKRILTFFPGLNPDILKILALLTMTMDHAASILHWPTGDTETWRLIGRFSFPLFVFLLVSHLAQKDVFKKYMERLFPFAVLSTLALSPVVIVWQEERALNILWTLLLPVVALFLLKKLQAETMPLFFKGMLALLIVGLMGTLSLLTEYSVFGFAYILSFYAWKKTSHKLWLALLLPLAFLINFHPVLAYGILSVFFTVLLLPQAPQKPHRRFLKPWWIFYVYYPLHLLIFYTLKNM